MKKIKVLAVILSFVFVFSAFAACAGDDPAPAAAAGDYPVISLAPRPIQQAVGPLGEALFSYDDLYLTDEEVEQIRAGGYTAAIVMHYGGSDWSRLAQTGAQTKLEYLGIEVLAITSADFNDEQQVADLETVMALNPDIIISIPTDPATTADAFMRVAEAGIHLVFFGNVADGMVHGQHYISAVACDNFGGGANAARMMGQALGGEGRIGHVYHDAVFFVTNQRDIGFRETIRDEFPGIEIVESAGFDDIMRAGEVADAMLTRTPDLDGIHVTWDTGAELVVSSAIAAGRTDIFITSCDLGDNVARMIAEKGLVVGISAQRPFHHGISAGILAGMGLVGRDAPPYVVVPPIPTYFSNILEVYEIVFNAPPPGWLVDLYEANQ